MLRRLLFWLLLATCLLTACGNDESVPAEDSTPTATHTVILYFPWSGTASSSSSSLLSYIKYNISAIESAIARDGGLGTTRAVMLLATNSSSATLSEIAYQDTLCVENVLRDYSDVDLTQTAALTALFDVIAEASATPTYSIILGCHGSGWLPRDADAYKATRAFGGGDSTTRADITQLAEAIEQSAIGHMVYVCFDDCYMANIEVAYDMRTAADYLLASTSEVMDVGLPYAYEWRYLKSATPDYSAIVTQFYNFYLSYAYPYGAFSVVDCAYVEATASLMRQLNSVMDSAGITPQDVSPQYLDGYTSHVFYDWQDYYERVAEALRSADAELYEASLALFDELDSVRQKLIVAHCCTPYIYSGYCKGTIRVESNCGLTISDPTTNSVATSCIEQTAWWEATH